jgi:hypothetical protein
MREDYHITDHGLEHAPLLALGPRAAAALNHTSTGRPDHNFLARTFGQKARAARPNAPGPTCGSRAIRRAKKWRRLLRHRQV